MKIEQLANKTLEEIKKAKKKPYPYYYRETFNKLAREQNLNINPCLILEEETIDEEFLDKTKETAEFIQTTNTKLKEESYNFLQEIEQKESNQEIKHLIQDFEDTLIAKLNESNAKIEALQTELEKVYNELNMDTLTKAFSRKALDKQLKTLVKQGKHHKLNTALIVVDLDKFKHVNDTYGHLVGDFVLVRIVKIIKHTIREQDQVFRFGGDEFVVIINKANLGTIRSIAKQIRTKIERTKLKYKSHYIHMTVSLGVSCHHKGDDVEDWLDRADKAVYESKKDRNKVTFLC
ncbi:MAG: diguanylate cyclase [Epsilonproteobacteria bacterium]|nr:diguanylate cyclase [Campylobacterota bacterium]